MAKMAAFAKMVAGAFVCLLAVILWYTIDLYVQAPLRQQAEGPSFLTEGPIGLLVAIPVFLIGLYIAYQGEKESKKETIREAIRSE